MRMELMVADGFYNDPKRIRAFALNQEWNVTGNFPGVRTRSFLDDEMKEMFQSFVGPWGGKVIYWGSYEEDGQGYSGAFQMCTAVDRTWIHSDSGTNWAAIVYLTPDAPLSAGTAFYKHKESGNYTKESDDDVSDHDGNDYTKWEMTDYVANKFNRMILYNSKLYHASLDYFGNNKNNGRLFQTFFFKTEK